VLGLDPQLFIALVILTGLSTAVTLERTRYRIADSRIALAELEQPNPGDRSINAEPSPT
jgi:hypothetical protein